MGVADPAYNTCIMPLDLNRTSFSELSTLSQCEQRWTYRYLNRQEEQERSGALQLGSFLHDAIGTWWDDQHLSMASAIIKIADDGGYSEESTENGTWLALRYEEQYQEDRAASVVRVIGRELRFEAALPGTAVRVLAYIDGLELDRQGRLWIVERKSMAQWSRLDSLAVDPQVTTYIWIARANGLPVHGLKFDAIRTYRWALEKPTLSALAATVLQEQPELTKKAAMEIAHVRQDAHPGVERPVYESFEQRWIDRTDAHIAEALEEMKAALVRRQMLAAGMRPIRNIGQGCNQCPFKDKCWDQLAFPESIEIEE